MPYVTTTSCAGTNLKVGDTSANFLSCPFTFWLLKYNLLIFGERFHDGQYSLGSFFVCCSSTHGAPVPPVICKSEVHVSLPRVR